MKPTQTPESHVDAQECDEVEPKVTVTVEERRDAIDCIDMRQMTKAKVKKLLDACEEWPEHALAPIRDLPIHQQFLSQRISARSFSAAWQMTDIILYPGTQVQIYDGNGAISYNSRTNYVNTFGRDLQNGSYHNAEGGDFPCLGRVNKWGFFASTTTYFRNSAIGYGAGLFAGRDPFWNTYWLITGSDQGRVETICNDDYYNDNSGEYSAVIEWRPASVHLKWMLDSPFLGE